MFKIKKILITLVLILIIGFIIFFKNNLLNNYANFFIINNAKKGADLVLILSGSVLTRAPHAFQLIKDNYSSRVMITTMKWHILPYGLKYPSDIELAIQIKEKYKS